MSKNWKFCVKAGFMYYVYIALLCSYLTTCYKNKLDEWQLLSRSHLLYWIDLTFSSFTISAFQNIPIWLPSIQRVQLVLKIFHELKRSRMFPFTGWTWKWGAELFFSFLTAMHTILEQSSDIKFKITWPEGFPSCCKSFEWTHPQ